MFSPVSDYSDSHLHLATPPNRHPPPPSTPPPLHEERGCDDKPKAGQQQGCYGVSLQTRAVGSFSKFEALDLFKYTHKPTQAANIVFRLLSGLLFTTVNNIHHHATTLTTTTTKPSLQKETNKETPTKSQDQKSRQSNNLINKQHSTNPYLQGQNKNLTF